MWVYSVPVCVQWYFRWMDSWNTDYTGRWSNEDNKKKVPSIDAEVISVCVGVTVSAGVPVCVSTVT